MIKKRLSALLLVLGLLLATGCQNIMDNYTADKPIAITASSYPIYVLALNIAGGVPGVELDCLIQPQDGCLRSYSLSEWDIVRMMETDLVLVGGRGLESYEPGYVSDQIASISLMDSMALIEGDPDAGEDSHLATDNPWYFLSIEGGLQLAEAIAHSLAQLDPLYAEAYAKNLVDFQERMDVLAGRVNAAMYGVRKASVAVLHEGLIYAANELGVETALQYDREQGADLYDNDYLNLLEQLEASNVKVILIEKQAPAGLVASLAGEGYSIAKMAVLTAHTADGDPLAYEEALLSNARALAAALAEAK